MEYGNDELALRPPLPSPLSTHALNLRKVRGVYGCLYTALAPIGCGDYAQGVLKRSPTVVMAMSKRAGALWLLASAIACSSGVRPAQAPRARRMPGDDGL